MPPVASLAAQTALLSHGPLRRRRLGQRFSLLQAIKKIA